MTVGKKKIIAKILENFKYNAHFENEHFIYWVEEESWCAGEKISRDEFKKIKQHVIETGELPKLPTLDEEDNIFEEIDLDNFNFDNLLPFGECENSLRADYSCWHNQRMLRYSKTYDSIELYDYNTELKKTIRNQNRILAVTRRNKILSVNTKGYVLLDGNRWLSLKNWKKFSLRNFNRENGEALVRLLMKSMLGDKDWIDEIDYKNYWIHNKSSRKANSFEELLMIECGVKPVKSIRRLFNNDVNEIIKFYKLINPNKVHDITNFVKRNKDNINTLFKTRSGELSANVLYYYFLSRDNRCDENTLCDYFRMLVDEGRKVNLDISSYSTLKSNHDKLSREILLKQNNSRKTLGVSRVFPKIKSTPDIEVEMIRTAKRLDMESFMLNHCVHSYKETIRRGTCAIYSLLYEGERYTLQVNVIKEPKTKDPYIEDKEELLSFKAVQLKGKYNYSPPESMKESLEVLFEENGLLPLESSGIYFKREDEESDKKRRIVQKGEKILNDLIDGSFHGKREAEYLPF